MQQFPKSTSLTSGSQLHNNQRINNQQDDASDSFNHLAIASVKFSNDLKVLADGLQALNFATWSADPILRCIADRFLIAGSTALSLSTSRNPMCRIVVAIVTSILVTFACHASVAQTIEDTGLWFAALGNGKFESLDDEAPIRWWFDAHYRLRDDTGGFNQSIIRPGLGYAISDNQAVWAGYGWIETSPVVGNNFDEHRFWQQWTYSPSSGPWKFLHRSRFEQRWLEFGDDVGLRWRQLARCQKVLNACPEISFILWDEVFFNLNETDWGASSGLDQNRAFIGFGYKRCKESRVRTEIGYLNQFVDRQRDGMNHILSVNFFF